MSVTQTDLKKVSDEIKALLHEEREANDERLKALQDVGTEYPETKSKVLKIEAALNESQDRMEKLQKEMQSQADQIGGLIVGGVGSQDLSAERQHAANFLNSKTGVKRKNKVKPEDVDVEAYRAYKEAWEELVYSGCNIDSLSTEFRNTLTVGSDPAGGYLVPDEHSNQMEKRIFESSNIRPYATVLTINAPAWEAPFKSADATSGGWVGERDSRTATATPTVGMQRIEVHEQYAYPEVSQNMLDDGAINVEDFIVMETEDKMIRTENTGFVAGNGTMKPRGFANPKETAVTTDDSSRSWGVLQYIPTGAAGALPTVSGQTSGDPDCFITTISKMNPAYLDGAVWTMSRATAAVIRKMKDRNDRYLVGFGNLSDPLNRFQFDLFGFPIVTMEDMPAIASNSFSIAFANLKGYYIIDRIGFRVVRDPYTNKPYVGFYISKRVGGDVRNFDMIKLVKFAAS